ncbi:MAG: pyruvate ferredoxin oxidoreductase [Phycisphaerae bacterium]|nr:MAG: pyruvate ferredoxin oxidoreductase [Planctomycetota bacterium]KAB2944550.1 MAG: pyruvate ferredoxin oxidoreductase [Phycisphaerae bacterium]MBE7456025.1 pyruvate ferredoxin oxidoreductase [Planctomycetia bacterium]MCK6465152.1 pyruvate ferredoxin oxidoreductase [Phycisphaerae bacterium]MCL4717283.1 pyruvate ferredoxin oxidoreductase [Phycisphaerae bacterium]
MKALVTGNHAAGHALAACGEANRSARGCAAGAYPITPQTEIIEFLRAFNFSRGRVVPVESEHSAMAVCIGASMNGARAFTASSANGLAYMVENVFAAGYLRLPIVLVAVNRTLGPPWNIWVDQGDSLMFRDAAWIQFYTESHQDLVDTILLAFRVAEDPRVMLPACVAMDGFVVSHTLMGVELPDQVQVDRFLPPCHVPHRLRVEHPATIGGLTWPRESEHQRRRIQDAMERVPQVLEEARDEFEAVFGRRPDGAIRADHVDGAEDVLVACNTMARTARRCIEARREQGDPVGLVKIKLFRPFPRDAMRTALKGVRRVGVLDRNHSPGSGGVFWGEVAATLQGRGDVVVQDYIVGLAGGDVTPELLGTIADDLHRREGSAEPVWQEVG